MVVDVGVKPPFPDEYIGDGAYVGYDGFQFRLYTSDGIRVTNEVFLEPLVLESFERYVKRVRERNRG